MDATVAKFVDPDFTATGRRRAQVEPTQLETLWFNTGTLCNLLCKRCYIESSPRNDRLVYLTAAEVDSYLDEIEREALGTNEIGFTGGEPFMNPELPAMVESSLARGYRVLLLTNAMRPMMKRAEALAALIERYGGALEIRVSMDHYDPATHELERGRRSWKPTEQGLKWLADLGANISVAGRTCWGEDDDSMRMGFRNLFASLGVEIDVDDPARLVLFPEMDESVDVPEITTECWDILGLAPQEVMCATSRMVVRRKGADHPVVLACTLLPYDERFELGRSLREALRPVKLNHPHCAKFCVLGGGSCSVKDH